MKKRKIFLAINNRAPIISIHLENDLGEFTSTVVDGGDLSWSAAAALRGSLGGMACLADDTNAIYGVKSGFTSTTGKVRWRFYIDPNTITIPTANEFVICYMFSAANTVATANLRYVTGVGYRIKGRIINDTGGGTDTAYTTVTDAPHYVELYLQRAATAASSDGSISIWIDGVLKSTITGVDNFDRFASFTSVRLGLAETLPATTAGTIFFDELVVRNDGRPIGA